MFQILGERLNYSLNIRNTYPFEKIVNSNYMPFTKIIYTLYII